MAKNVLSVDWKVFNGAAVKRRMLRLKSNADGIFLCPVEDCLHIGFKSQRGLRKHIDTRHAWYYYFDVQPSFKREDVTHENKLKLKQTTHTMPAFSLDDGVGKDFLLWLGTPCGGGKTVKEGTQIARRAMKFLMASLGDSEVEKFVKEEYVDCCLGSPSVVIRFLQTLTEDWELTSSASLNYLKSMCDLLDFRKASGVSDAVLRTFTVTEVYLRRGKENLSKKKRLEYSRNLDLETLIAKDSWASIEEMEKVIPYHTAKYKSVVQKSSGKDNRPTISEFAFATRFIATFLFLRVKCARPMTYQFITLDMIETAKESDGFIDQTAFKTSDNYVFDTLIISEDVMQVLDTYITMIRPLLNPTCDYLLVSTAGKQYQSFTTAMTLLVKEAIGKYINPTRYRQIIETESAERLDSHEREIISKDQKHSSQVAKRCYQKKLSRDVATQGKQCMDKIVGAARTQTTQQLADIVSDIHTNSMEFEQSVIDKVRSTLQPIPQVIDLVNIRKENVHGATPQTNMPSSSNTKGKESIVNTVDNEISITCTREGIEEYKDESPSTNTSFTATPSLIQSVSNDVEVKKEEAEQQLQSRGKSKRFTADEDRCLRMGIEKYGKGAWSFILHDVNYNFHPARSRDSLRMRAETCAFKISKNIKS